MPLLTLQDAPSWLLRSQQEPASDPNARRPTFALYTLGCKVNQADSHQIARMLLASGLERVPFAASADVYVIDTCTVTQQADRKSRQIAARAARLNPQAIVAVTGCAATYSREQFEQVVPGALILPNAQKMELPERVLEKLRQKDESSRQWSSKYLQMRAEEPIEPQFKATRERAVIKIQDGCSHACSYCIIPSVRGASVSKSPAAIVREARQCVREGAREIVLTGVSMGEWKGTAQGPSPKQREPQARAGRVRGATRRCAACCARWRRSRGSRACAPRRWTPPTWTRNGSAASPTRRACARKFTWRCSLAARPCCAGCGVATPRRRS